MKPALPASSCVPIVAVLFVVLMASAASADDARPAPPGIDKLPAIPQLPDPFLFPDGSRVKTAADWKKRREQIRDLVLDYEYGHLPPNPGNVKGAIQSTQSNPDGSTEQNITVSFGPDDQPIRVSLVLTTPPGKGPFPVIVKGDLCWKRVKPEIVANVIKRGYALAEFDRTQVAPDDAKTYRSQGIYKVYPQADGGDLVAWAYGFSRVIDYLVTVDSVDKGRIIVTGHSRGGKAALLAGALDERAAMVVPNGSGAGGAGCYRIEPPRNAQGKITAEDLQAIATHFPNWFSPNFQQFIDHVEQLPFDQHEVRALVAPRPLLNTDAFGDLWANGPGTQATYLAAREVYTFLGAADQIGIHYRQGGHEQTLEDFTALMDFADQQLLGKPAAQDLTKLPFPEQPKAYSWTAPERAGK